MPEGPTARVRQAFLRACELDVAVRKPGNVSLASAGHGMQARQFLDSAQAAADPLCAPGAPVGARIEGAVRATLAVAGCNTNLGILLLCAPLAAAAQMPASRPLRERVDAVLHGLDVGDAAAAFRAIALAHPGGLGRADAQDVHDAPTVTLLAAMHLAAHRDQIAHQYAVGFNGLFAAARQAAVPADGGAPGDAVPPALAHAMIRVYLYWLARVPDSHIVRKHGEAVAQTVMTAAQGFADHPAPHDDPAWAAWDESLKQAGWNPGTSADLTVATLMLTFVGA